MGRLCTLLLLALMGTACIRGGPPPDKIRSITKGAFTGFQEQTNLVITNETQWAAVWQKHSIQASPAKALPKIDFEKETVLFAGAGQKRSGGYSVEISRVEEVDGKTVVTITTRTPKPGGFTIQSLTAPFHIIAVPRIKGPVLFKAE